MVLAQDVIRSGRYGSHFVWRHGQRHAFWSA